MCLSSEIGICRKSEKNCRFFSYFTLNCSKEIKNIQQLSRLAPSFFITRVHIFFFSDSSSSRQTASNSLITKLLWKIIKAPRVITSQQPKGQSSNLYGLKIALTHASRAEQWQIVFLQRVPTMLCISCCLGCSTRLNRAYL